jgi:hypothetical protein
VRSARTEKESLLQNDQALAFIALHLLQKHLKLSDRSLRWISVAKLRRLFETRKLSSFDLVVHHLCI